MDFFTHALTSLAVARGFFPRRPWWFVLSVVLAGTIADLDLLTSLFGAGAFLAGRYTVTHSVVGTMCVIAIAFAIAFLLGGRSGPTQKAGPTGLIFAVALAAVLHLATDLCASPGVALLWPFRGTRFALDWLPVTDPWIFGLLLAGILLPELFGLVGAEIGAKDQAPRGRNGALIALALVLLYTGVRATMHGNALAQLDAHSYRGETARRIAAFPDTLSLLTWHGVVETATAICSVDVPSTGSAGFDPERAACVHKPEESSVLTAAQQTETTRTFVTAARFPKASVGSTEDGTEVVIRDMRDAALDETRFALAARELLDRSARVVSQRIVWAREVHLK